VAAAVASLPTVDTGRAKSALWSSCRSLVPIRSIATLPVGRLSDPLPLVAPSNQGTTGTREFRPATLAWCDLPRVGSAPASLSPLWLDYGPETIPRLRPWSSRSHHPENHAGLILTLGLGVRILVSGHGNLRRPSLATSSYFQQYTSQRWGESGTKRLSKKIAF
jgi:hypothetical protein